MILKLVVCILLCVVGRVQGFRLTQHWFEYFILFSNRYMFRSYNHLQAEIIHGRSLVIWSDIITLEDGHKTETCSGY
jgi:hypothetical protein